MIYIIKNHYILNKKFYEVFLSSKECDSIIQEGDKDTHSLFTSQNLMSPNTTSYHLKVHYVKSPGKYTCQVFSIEGKQLDHVTHQVSVKGVGIIKHILYICFTVIFVLENTSESSLLGTLFNRF